MSDFCVYCERDYCDTDCSFADHYGRSGLDGKTEPVSKRKTAAEIRAEGFLAGYDAGWSDTGEGHNSECSSPKFTQEAYEAARAEALAAHRKGRA